MPPGSPKLQACTHSAKALARGLPDGSPGPDPLSRPSPRGKKNSRGAPRLRQIEPRYRVLTQVRRGVTKRLRTVAESGPAESAGNYPASKRDNRLRQWPERLSARTRARVLVGRATRRVGPSGAAAASGRRRMRALQRGHPGRHASPISAHQRQQPRPHPPCAFLDAESGSVHTAGHRHSARHPHP